MKRKRYTKKIGTIHLIKIFCVCFHSLRILFCKETVAVLLLHGFWLAVVKWFTSGRSGIFEINFIFGAKKIG